MPATEIIELPRRRLDVIERDLEDSDGRRGYGWELKLRPVSRLREGTRQGGWLQDSPVQLAGLDQGEEDRDIPAKCTVAAQGHRYERPQLSHNALN
jgi:hypothetical protein